MFPFLPETHILLLVSLLCRSYLDGSLVACKMQAEGPGLLCHVVVVITPPSAEDKTNFKSLGWILDTEHQLVSLLRWKGFIVGQIGVCVRERG